MKISIDAPIFDNLIIPIIDIAVILSDSERSADEVILHTTVQWLTSKRITDTHGIYLNLP